MYSKIQTAALECVLQITASGKYMYISKYLSWDLKVCQECSVCGIWSGIAVNVAQDNLIKLLKTL